MRLVVGVDQILDDGARLPQRQAGVRILDGRNATIGIDIDEGFFLDDAEIDHLCIIRETELLKDDGHFPWIGAVVDVSSVIYRRNICEKKEEEGDLTPRRGSIT